MRETLTATETLAKEGFLPMVYCVDDPIAAKQLEDAGAVAVMPLGAPIGSGLGIQNRVTIRLIKEGANVPVIVDAGRGHGIGRRVAMELGCDGVLMNTAIAEAKDPIRMARAMKLAVQGGRGLPVAWRREAGRDAKEGYLAGLSPAHGDPQIWTRIRAFRAQARADGVRIIPLCPFFKAQAQRHPEWTHGLHAYGFLTIFGDIRPLNNGGTAMAVTGTASLTIAEMREFAGLTAAEQRYIRRSLDIGLGRCDAFRHLGPQRSRMPRSAASMSPIRTKALRGAN